MSPPSSAGLGSVTGPRPKTIQSHPRLHTNASGRPHGMATNSAAEHRAAEPRHVPGSISLLLIHHILQRSAVHEALDVLFDGSHHAGAVLIRPAGDVRRDHHIGKLP